MNREEIRELFLSRGADLCGFASLDRFHEAPEGIDYVLIGGEIAAKDCQIVNGNCGKAVRG